MDNKRRSVTHDLKLWPVHFEPVRLGQKTAEVRVSDRDYQVGDSLHLREWDPDHKEYTGRSLYRPVRHLLHGTGYGILPGYVVISIGVE